MICANLSNELGTNVQFLSRVLPSVHLLLSPGAPIPPTNTQVDIGINVNFMTLCFLLQRFLKVVSACSGSGMLFLDGKSGLIGCTV